MNDENADKCKCSAFIDARGIGNCQKRDHRFLGSMYSCYLEDTSECSDAITSDVEPNKKISAEACLGIKNKVKKIYFKS